jgi:hypothetical protein
VVYIKNQRAKCKVTMKSAKGTRWRRGMSRTSDMIVPDTSIYPAGEEKRKRGLGWPAYPGLHPGLPTLDSCRVLGGNRCAMVILAWDGPAKRRTSRAGRPTSFEEAKRDSPPTLKIPKRAPAAAKLWRDKCRAPAKMKRVKRGRLTYTEDGQAASPALRNRRMDITGRTG